MEELLQSRRLVVTRLLAYMPTPFLFQELPRSIPPPLPPTVSCFSATEPTVLDSFRCFFDSYKWESGRGYKEHLL